MTGPNDALSDLAPLLRVRPELQDFCRFGGDWTAVHEDTAGGVAQFHIVARGRCVLDRPGREALQLEAGDILLLPRGDAHLLRARIGSGQAVGAIATRYRNAIRLNTTDAPAETELVCGLLHFEATGSAAAVAALPEVIVLRAGPAAPAARLQALVGAMAEELEGGGPGALAIATDLASALFVMFLRAHLLAQPPVEGLLALLGERSTSLAVGAMLRDPAAEWTLDALADLAATSRATLVRRFRQASGLAPLAFLTELRLGLARQRLAAGGMSIAQVGADLGYASEAAFSRAMLRRFGVRPGALRQFGGPQA